MKLINAISLGNIRTPALVLNRSVLERNCKAMADRAVRLGVNLRPHLKTAKSAEVARIATFGQQGGISVSTLAEAEYFAAHGFRDQTYAVGIEVGKVDALQGIQQIHGAKVTIITDSVDVISKVAARARAIGATFPLLIEIDCGGGRGGVRPDAPAVLEIANLAAINSDVISLCGVLTHAGQSYHVNDLSAIRAVAETERSSAVRAADRLREAGFHISTVSVGSTPTAVCAQSLTGITEIRPGVYTFFDLDQVAREICDFSDIAISVLATVIGHNQSSERVLIDAGALALSKDTSASHLRDDMGYGLVIKDGSDAPLTGVFVAEVHQEHGLIATNGDLQALFRALPIGSRVRVLPHHACMTAAPYDNYYVVRNASSGYEAIWSKARGW